MPMITTLDLAPARVTAAGEFHYTTEASTAGLPPCTWPEGVTVPGLGNGLVFMRDRIWRSDDGDLLGIEYRQQLGCLSIMILND
jgi:hypothetical protein